MICQIVAEDLLRPYASCPHVQYHRKQVLNSLMTPGLVTEACKSVVKGLELHHHHHGNLTMAAGQCLLDDDAVLGVYYACQTDLTLFPPSEEEVVEEDETTSSSTLTGSSFACTLVEPILEVSQSLDLMIKLGGLRWTVSI